MFIAEPDIPFSKDDTQQIIPIIVALMAYLAAILLVVGVQLNTGLFYWNKSYSKSISIKIPTDEHEKTAKKASDILNQFSNIKSYNIVKKEKVMELLSPWFSKNTLPEAISLPLIIEVVLIKQDSRLIENIKLKIQTVLPKAKIYTRDKWVENMSDLITNIQIFAFLIVALLMTITVGVIVLITRIGLKLHEHVIELLHSIGAEDEYIARQFAYNSFWLGIKGAFIGVVFAGITLIGINTLIYKLNLTFFSRFDVITILILIFVLAIIPIISTYSAKVTVIKNLSKLP